MSKMIEMTDALHEYMLAKSVHEDAVLQALREETSELEYSMMQIGPEQGRFMAWLVALMGAKTCIEVGTFTGYSALCVARAIGEDGRLICCDVNEEWTSMGRKYWEQAGVADRIDLRIGPATETLDELRAQGREGTVDFIFVDADKTAYDAYYEHGLALLRSGGVIAIDNVLWGGDVVDASNDEESTKALRALNDKIAADSRVDLTMLPICDGLTLARKL